MDAYWAIHIVVRIKSLQSWAVAVGQIRTNRRDKGREEISVLWVVLEETGVNDIES